MNIEEILHKLEIVARKHTIEVCDGSKIETIPASLVNELRLNYFSAKILLNYINKQKEVLDKIKEYINRTEINSVGTPLAYTEIGKELLELLEEIE